MTTLAMGVVWRLHWLWGWSGDDTDYGGGLATTLTMRVV